MKLKRLLAALVLAFTMVFAVPEIPKVQKPVQAFCAWICDEVEEAPGIWDDFWEWLGRWG